MTAILDALHEGPDWGSPLYVFTDASAKDDSRTNIEEIKEMAELQGNTINFFTTGKIIMSSTSLSSLSSSSPPPPQHYTQRSHCNNPSYKSFQELADATSGQVLILSNHQELLKLTGFTGSVLGGSNVISSGSNVSNRKKRRAAGDHRYSIKVDDSIGKMSICVTTTRPNQGAAILLINPRGVKITSGKTSMTKISVYEMTRPLVGSHCNNPSYKSFQELADATSGQVLILSNHQELLKLTGFTGSVLGGSNVISSGSNVSNRKKRRAAGDHRYSIKVDDSIGKMSICVTTTRPNQGAAILLINPRGVKITSGKTSMTKISVYEMTRPLVGTWALVIPSSSGKHTYYVKSTSDTNIDFEHFFMQSMPGPVTDVPVSDPLIGYQSKLILTLAGYEKVQKNTTTLELISKYGEHIRNVTLNPDKRGMRYVAALNPPSQPFKLKIKGTTKAGNSFERVSRNVIEPKHVLLRVLRSDKDFTLRRGQMSTVTFHIFNGEARNIMIKISAKDRLGYVVPVRRNRRRVRGKKWAFFRVVFRVPSNAKIGSSDTAMVTVTYKNGARVLVKPVQLLVVA
ncbi:Hemicentin-2 [Exaiptasia diaphana]|nr:Hemicentin-2 [Exaiptasia diaphana]